MLLIVPIRFAPHLLQSPCGFRNDKKAFFDLAAQKKRLKILARSIILHTFAARNRHSYDKTTF